MISLLPPKAPFKLALYCFAWFILLSLVWDLLLQLPTKGTNGMILLMLAAVGYVYGTHHGFLPMKRALLTSLYFSLPILALRLGPVLMNTSDIPPNEIASFVMVASVILVAGVGMQLLFSALVLSFASKFATKKSG